MLGQGIHYALTRPQVADLLRAAGQGDEVVIDAINVIEDGLDDQTRQSTDQAWEYIHRALTGDSTPGLRLDPRAGRPPLNRCILGGRHLKPGGCIMACLITPEEVAALASALAEIDQLELRRRFFALACTFSEGVFDYAWGWFWRLRVFLQRAASRDMAAVFKADRCSFSRSPRYGPA